MSQSLNIVKNKSDELPNNIEAEQSIIGSILLSNEIFDEINIIISSKNFYDPMHQKIFAAIEKLIYKGMLANPITLRNHFENEKDELNIPEYLVKITKFSTSSRQSIEYSKIIYDLYVKRELIKISDNIIDTAKLNDLNNDGQQIIENFEKSLFDLAEKGSFNSSIVKFDEAMRQTIEMASNAYKNEEGIVGVPSGLNLGLTILGYFFTKNSCAFLYISNLSLPNPPGAKNTVLNDTLLNLIIPPSFK